MQIDPVPRDGNGKYGCFAGRREVRQRVLIHVGEKLVSKGLRRVPSAGTPSWEGSAGSPWAYLKSEENLDDSKLFSGADYVCRIRLLHV